MIEQVTVERLDKTGLVKWEWRFWYDNHTLWLDTYTEYQRPSRRHAFRGTQSYHRADPRKSTLSESDVVIYANVVKEAIDKFTTGITVKRWSERNG